MDNTNDNLQYLLLKIRNQYPSFTKAFKRIADYILENYEEALYVNITEFAKKCNVSESTITKFIKSIGYNRYSELKICLARNEKADDRDELYGEISLDNSPEEICNNLFYSDIEALKNTLRVLDIYEFEKAAKMIVNAGKIDIYGQGSATVATTNAKMRFYRIGLKVFCYNDPHEQIVSASLLTSNDVAIAISNSGRSSSIVTALSAAKKAGAETICITNHDNSPLSSYSDVKLFTSTCDSKELYESMQSRVAELALVDSLFICAASKMKNNAVKSMLVTSDALKAYKL